MASFSFNRLPILDNLEIFSSEDESSYFPNHFHDVFCISLITKGMEQLITEGGVAFAPFGKISITNAREVHQNKSALINGYSYKTVYVSPDLLSYLNNGNPIHNFQQVIDDAFLYTKMHHLIASHCTRAKPWKDTISLLIKYQKNDRKFFDKVDRFRSIDTIVDNYKDERINLKSLSKLFHLSPYHFIREFKKAKGITPQTYIMLKRLQNVKKDLLQSGSLIDVAWSNGFYDISHLNYSFKKFFGTTAKAYLNSNNLH